MILFLFLAAAPAEDALVAPAFEQVPTNGEIDVPVNSALVLRRFPAPRGVRLIEGATETNLPLETAVPGITVARLPEQPPNSSVRVVVEQDFDNDGIVDFSEDIAWTTGTRRLPAAAAPPVLRDARVEHPLFEERRALIEAEADNDRAALALFRVDENNLRTLVNVQFGATQFVDFSYQGGVQEYLLLGVDRAGNVSEPTDATVGEGGCNAAGAPAPLAALLVLLARRRFASRRGLRKRGLGR